MNILREMMDKVLQDPKYQKFLKGIKMNNATKFLYDDDEEVTKEIIPNEKLVEVDIEIVTNNDGHEFCNWCQEPTKKVYGANNEVYNLCKNKNCKAYNN